MNSRDLQRLFQRDAAHAYAVLTRDHALEPEPKKGLKRLLHRARLAFLGLSYQLSPARRPLFALALFLLLGSLPRGGAASGPLLLDFSPPSTAERRHPGLSARPRAGGPRPRARRAGGGPRAAVRPAAARPAGSPAAVAHSYRTANEVGGDYYHLLPLPDGRPRCRRGCLRARHRRRAPHGDRQRHPEDVARPRPGAGRVAAAQPRDLRIGDEAHVHEHLLRRPGPGDGPLEYVCAGHPFPLLRRADGGSGAGQRPALGMRGPCSAGPARPPARRPAAGVQRRPCRGHSAARGSASASTASPPSSPPEAPPGRSTTRNPRLLRPPHRRRAPAGRPDADGDVVGCPRRHGGSRSNPHEQVQTPGACVEKSGRLVPRKVAGYLLRLTAVTRVLPKSSTITETSAQRRSGTVGFALPSHALTLESAGRPARDGTTLYLIGSGRQDFETQCAVASCDGTSNWKEGFFLQGSGQF